MSFLPEHYRWLERWLMFGAVSLAFLFLNGATFTSLGVVLFVMVGELHWSLTEAGFCFSLLGIACGLSSPLPALLVKPLGGRLTMALGALLLAIGFIAAGASQALIQFYGAMILLGVGFSFAGNVPAVYLIANRFPSSSARVIGYYLMIGAFGAALGPPVVEAIASALGWRGHWFVMAGAAFALMLLCLALIGSGADAKPAPANPTEPWPQPDPAPEPVLPPAHDVVWTARSAIATPQFMVVAAVQAMTMACVTTNNSFVVPHLVHFGATASMAAIVLSVIALCSTLAKGLCGKLCEIIAPPRLMALGVALQALGNVALAYAATTWLQFGAGLTFGAGWGLAYVAGTVTLVNFFGRDTGSRILSVVWMLTTVAAAGPPLAGWLADEFGNGAPVFFLFAVILAGLAPASFLLAPPKLPAPAGLEPIVASPSP